VDPQTAFDRVPNEIIDAGFVDGCTQLGTLRWVLLPLARSALVAALVVAFLASWKRLPVCIAFITKRGLYTAGLGMAELIGAGTRRSRPGLIFSVLPVGLFMLVQRHIVRGLMAACAQVASAWGVPGDMWSQDPGWNSTLAHAELVVGAAG